MNRDTYRIRAFDPGDYAREATVWTSVDPVKSFTAEELRHYDEKVLTPPMTNFKVVVEERAERQAVGFGYLHSDVESFDPETFWIEIAIDPIHQGKGLGLALAAEAGREAVQRHARRLWAAVRADDARAVRFLSRQGFSEQMRAWRSRLDLAGAAVVPDRTAVLERQGVSFTTLAEEDLDSPELLHQLYELTVATSADEPRLGRYTPVTFEQFVERDLRGPGFLPDGFLLASEKGRFVAMSVLHRTDGDTQIIRQAFTGTRREVRGRGIATELKRRGVEYARAHGYRTIRTGNDSRNYPMLAINRKFGFQPEEARIFGEKNLQT